MKPIWLCEILVLVFVIASCSPYEESPLPTAVFESPLPIPITVNVPPIILEEGRGAIQGRLSTESLPWNWRGKEVRVYACPFSGPSDEEGFYILEPSVHPNALVSSEGFFRLANLPPGAYVIVVGPSPEEAIAVQELGRVKVFHVQAGQVLDLGEVSLTR